MKARNAELNQSLNEQLNQLKQIFDRIERYDSKQNIGFRSLKNLGVWLIAYALTEKNQQILVINELANMAALTNHIDEIKKLIDNLATPNHLTLIVTDYEKANGKFTISVKSAFEADVKKKAREVGIDGLLQNRLDNNFDKNGFALKMINTVRFVWAKQKRERDWGKRESVTTYAPVEYVKSSRKFENENQNIPFLTADESVDYMSLKFKQNVYHVARLRTLQEDGQPAYAYLIEADQAKDCAQLQKSYLDILRLVKNKKQADFNESYAEAHRNGSIAHIKIREEIIDKYEYERVKADNKSYKFKDIYVPIVHFPELAEPLQTEEKRLGVYSVFLNKIIGNVRADKIEYLGKRELQYDNKGGVIKNHEELSVVVEGAGYPVIIDHRRIYIEFTVSGPFMMVYESPDEADYYPFQVVNPRADLVKNFSAKTSYLPRLEKSVSSHSMFKQPQNTAAADAEMSHSGCRCVIQ